jgi:hypothetical protein
VAALAPGSSGSKAARYHVGRAKLSIVLTLGFEVHVYRRMGLGLSKHQPMAAH